MNVLKKENFLYRYLCTILSNLTGKKSIQGWQYPEELIQFALLVRFYGGTSVFDVIKGKSLLQTTNLTEVSKFFKLFMVIDIGIAKFSITINFYIKTIHS